MPDFPDRSPRFATTRWTVVLAAKDRTAPERAAALESLCRIYWYPIYAYARRTGRERQEAEDLTQGFFCRLLEKEWLTSVAPERGRFRAFLIVAFKRFLGHELEKHLAAKRGGGVRPVPLDSEEAESRYRTGPVLLSDADALYERGWALALLDRTMTRLEDDHKASGRAGDFDRLKVRLTAGRGEIAYGELAAELGVNEATARVALSRFRKRFREFFREAVADTVADPADVDAEMRHLAEILGRG